MPTLLGLPYSPWTEKARFALDVKRIAYRFRTYQPLLGEPALRLAQRKLTGKVSVPVLLTDDGATVPDSTEIARWADRRGEGTALFPVEHDAAIADLARIAETALSTGRALALLRMLDDEAALMEMVPPPIARTVGKVALPIAAFGVRRTLRKYGLDAVSAAEHERARDEALDALRARLAARPEGDGAKTLLDAFTFADIAVTGALAFVEPPTRWLKIGQASRRTFTDPAAADRHRDLLDWRDALYARYRTEPVTSSG